MLETTTVFALLGSWIGASIVAKLAFEVGYKKGYKDALRKCDIDLC